MIVVGVDPGARDTGIVAVDLAVPTRPRLLSRVTVSRDKAEPMLDVNPAYLGDVVKMVRALTQGLVVEGAAGVVAVEKVSRPSQFLNGSHARGGRGGAAADPSAIMATGFVVGAVTVQSWAPCELVMVPAGKKGQGPPATYPAELLDRGGRVAAAGNRRHERSAFDVARAGLGRLPLVRRRVNAYA